MERLGEVIGSRIVQARLSAGWRQTDLAIHADIDLALLNKYESGKKEAPALKNLIKIADACDVSLDFLVGRDKS